MGFILGFLISLLLIFPSFIFIQVYLDGVSVATFFTNLFGGAWDQLMTASESSIMEPINVILDSTPEVWRIVFAFLPWVITAFIVAFFFRKKKAAVGGMIVTTTIMLGVALINHLVIRGETFDVGIFTEANMFYGYLIAIAVTLIIGSISGLISPFKKDGIPRKISLPVIEAPPGPYYMPTESPSRDQYMETNHAIPAQRQTSPDPMACEYCGSYLDPDTEYCSVCGNRVYDDT
ncbi:MAG: hypothetical protein ACTSXA_14265 [Candidatus Heimdallarchaeota archaeon]